MGGDRWWGTGLTAAQAMDCWLWLWLGYAERELAFGRRSPAPGAGEVAARLGAELAALESLSARLSAELPAPASGEHANPTYSRLRGGLTASSVEKLVAWLSAPSAPPPADLRRRAAEVLRQASMAPPPSPSRAAAIELWTWLTGGEADRRRLLTAAGCQPGAARQLGEELRLLQTIQAGVRRGQPDVIPTHPHEAHWLGARQPLPPATAAELARVLRRAHPELASGQGGPPLGQLILATASRLEALAGPAALAAALAREQDEARLATLRGKIAAGLAAAAGSEPPGATRRFLRDSVAARRSRRSRH